jgi:hypothetical protein
MADPIDSEITPEPADMKAASPAEAGTSSTPEITRPMLDVHAPHESIHTWKNFFIHLATISIGLLIAIGLEQTVEYVHHRHQIAGMMEKLRTETLENRDILLTNLKETDRVTSVVDDNLRSLAAIREDRDKTPFTPSPLPDWVGWVPTDTSWLMMRDSALLSIVPDLLVRNYFRIEVQFASLARWEWMATTARAQLTAALKAHASPAVLSAQERESLQRAYADFGVAMAGYRQRLKWTEVVLSMALANERIDIEAGRRHGLSAHPD